MLSVCLAVLTDGDDPAEFERMYYACRGGMLAYARKVLGEHADLAEDAVQQAFMDAARQMHRIAPLTGTQQQIWLLKAVRSWCFKLIRKEKRQQETTRRIAEETPLRYLPADGLERALDRLCRREQFDAIVDAIRSLPPIYKEVLYLYYVSGDPLETVAAHLGEKYSTVKTRYRRGHQLLLERLKERGIEP